jgi:hypothetical protein
MIGVVCHDAGGAEIVSSWLKAKGIPFIACLAGPALSVFHKRFPNLKPKQLKNVIDQCNSLLCGTSWQSTLEVEAIILARKSGKKTVAYLDHWVNYKKRFVSTDGLEYLPDAIWVGDDDAYDIAKKEFPETEVVLVPNCFFAEIQSNHNMFNASNSPKVDESIGLKILFVCEPISVHAAQEFGNPYHFGYDEYDSLEFFFQNLDFLDSPIDQIDIRPHPSELKEKYSWLECNHQPKVIVNNTPQIFDHIFGVDVVVGCESMAMILGLLAHKQVISVIPPEGKSCSLPHKGIKHLRDYINEL